MIENLACTIMDLCQKYNVSKLYAFGSLLRNDYRPGQSDIDLLVEFKPMDGYSRANAFFDLLDELERRLDAKVDLVASGALRNKIIAAEINRTKELIYAA